MPLPRSMSMRGPLWSANSGNTDATTDGSPGTASSGTSGTTFSHVNLNDMGSHQPHHQKPSSLSSVRPHLRMTSAPGLTTSMNSGSFKQATEHSTGSLRSFVGFSRYIRALFMVYVVVSVMYTMTHFYTMLRYNMITGQRLNSDDGLSSPGSAYPVTSVFRERTMVGKMVMSSVDPQSGGAIIRGLPLDQHRLAAATGGSLPAGMVPEISADIVYSKMFQYALQPTHIVPYFYRMTEQPVGDEIGIVTMITIERLHVVNNLVNKFQGPISVALHINDDETKLEALEVLRSVHDDNPLFAKHVDIHLIIDKYERQFNLWRNVARLFARTELIMSVDVDFMLCSDLRNNFARLSPEHRALVVNGTAVFVVPAFEFAKAAAEVDVEQYPANKQALLKYVESNDVSMFHQRWKRGHGPTDYPKWYKATEPYRIIDYNYNYEPYVLMKRDGPPWCDERFVGYGANKAACLYEIYLAGIQFWVLPEDFLIHQRHPYPENDRRVERKYNKRLYDAYREEVCLRYGRMTGGVTNDTMVDERICGANFQTYYGL